MGLALPLKTLPALIRRRRLSWYSGWRSSSGRFEGFGEVGRGVGGSARTLGNSFFFLGIMHRG